MHRDKKLGLALGILLVGSVGALFFRNESNGSTDLPQLANPAAIDAAIRQRSGTLPYLTESGVRETLAPERPTDTTPAVLRPSESDGRDNSAPSPIRIAGKAAVTPVAIPVPEARPISSASRSVDPVEEIPVEAVADAGDWQLYRVQSGDTLTGLAARHLGDAARFPEVYRANRDRLGNPNDLRAGMLIRLPTTRRPSRQTTPSQSIAETVAPPIPSGEANSPQVAVGRVELLSESNRSTTDVPPEAAPLRRRFVPVPRSPLSPTSYSDDAAASP